MPPDQCWAVGRGRNTKLGSWLLDSKNNRVLLGRKSSAMGAGDLVTALCQEVVGGHALLFWVFLGVERGARAVVEMKCDLGERRWW